MSVQKITPFLWFDNQAEEAVKFYTSIFSDSKIGKVTHYGKEGYEIHRMPEGKIMTLEFQIEGQKFVALNGGPHFKFTEAISFVISCETQEEGTIGKNSPKVEMKKRKCVAGLKTGMVCHGKSFQLF